MFDYDFLVKAVLFAACLVGVIFVNEKIRNYVKFINWCNKNKAKLSLAEKRAAMAKIDTNKNDILIYYILVALVLGTFLVYSSI